MIRTRRAPTRAALAATIVVGLVLAVPVGPATGQTTGDDDSGDCILGCGYGGVSPDGITAEVEFGSPGDGSEVVPIGESVFADCSWDRVAAGEELVIGRPDVASINITGSIFDEDHWIVYCPQLSGFDAYTIYPVDDPPPVPIIEDLIADAYARTPVVAFNPITSPDGDETIPLITQMTTFLWVDEAGWVTEVTATASVPGFSVTTTALPRAARWSGGEEPVWCTGDDMHPYEFGIGGDEAQPSSCSMVYTRSSAVEDHRIEVEVVWDVAYACSIPVCGGPLPDITTISTRPVLVDEIQAVNN